MDNTYDCEKLQNHSERADTKKPLIWVIDAVFHCLNVIIVYQCFTGRQTLFNKDTENKLVSVYKYSLSHDITLKQMKQDDKENKIMKI